LALFPPATQTEEKEAVLPIYADVCECTWLLHHDKPPSQTYVFTQMFLQKYKMAVISLALYSPDLAQFDFFLMPKTS
jgi:hypothetical protein